MAWWDDWQTKMGDMLIAPQTFGNLMPMPTDPGQRQAMIGPALLTLGGALSEGGRRGMNPIEAAGQGFGALAEQGQRQGMQKLQMGLLGSKIQETARKNQTREALKKNPPAGLTPEMIDFLPAEDIGKIWAESERERRFRSTSGGPPSWLPGGPTPAGGETPGGQFNVGNIRQAGGGFRTFPTGEEAVAATIGNVQAYPGKFNAGQPMTLPQIAERWAPKGDGANDPAAWARNVAQVGGLPLDKPLDFSNPDVAERFARGVHAAEFGQKAAYQPDVYKRGAGMALNPSGPQGQIPPAQTAGVTAPNMPAQPPVDLGSITGAGGSTMPAPPNVLAQRLSEVRGGQPLRAPPMAVPGGPPQIAPMPSGAPPPIQQAQAPAPPQGAPQAPGGPPGAVPGAQPPAAPDRPPQAQAKPSREQYLADPVIRQAMEAERNARNPAEKNAAAVRGAARVAEMDKEARSRSEGGSPVTFDDGIYWVDKQGNKVYKMGPRPERNEGEGREFSQEDKLRNAYTTQLKPFSEYRGHYQRIVAAGEKPSAAGDLAMVYGFMKMLDPTSVVREGEFATASNAGGIDDRLRTVYNKIINGERLTPDIRKDFLDRASRIFDKSYSEYEAVHKTYRGLAEGYKLNPDRVAPDLTYGVKRPTIAADVSTGAPPPVAPGASPSGAPAAAPQITKGTRAKNDAGVEILWDGKQWIDVKTLKPPVTR